jgi:hypothetical protein
MNIGEDYEVIQDPRAPKGRRIVKKGQAETAQTQVIERGASVYDPRLPNEPTLADLRYVYEEASGRKPDGRWSVARLQAEIEALD